MLDRRSEAASLRRHELKTRPGFFEAVWRGEKTFELRKDDRGFRAGDTLVLREWKPGTEYTGRSIEAIVTYLMAGCGLKRDHVCMAIEVQSRNGPAVPIENIAKPAKSRCLAHGADAILVFDHVTLEPGERGRVRLDCTEFVPRSFMLVTDPPGGSALVVESMPQWAHPGTRGIVHGDERAISWPATNILLLLESLSGQRMTFHITLSSLAPSADEPEDGE